MTVAAAHSRQKRPTARSNTLTVRLQPQLCDAIIDAAVARGMTASEWMRQAAMTCAMLEGVLSPDVRTDGKRRYARIEGGAIVDVRFIADQPNWSDPMGSTDSRSAGTLYDSIDGKRRYARIEGDQWKGGGYIDPPNDGARYVPILHVDSEPFDSAKHWRLNPQFELVRVDGVIDRVVCTYPVVVKSPEHA